MRGNFLHLYEISNAILAFQSIDVEHVLCVVYFSFNSILFGINIQIYSKQQFQCASFCLILIYIRYIVHWWRKTIFHPRWNYVIWIRTIARNYRKLSVSCFVYSQRDLRVYVRYNVVAVFIYQHFGVCWCVSNVLTSSIRIFTDGIHKAQKFSMSRCFYVWPISLFNGLLVYVYIFLWVWECVCVCVCSCFGNVSEFDSLQNIIWSKIVDKNTFGVWQTRKCENFMQILGVWLDDGVVFRQNRISLVRDNHTAFTIHFEMLYIRTIFGVCHLFARKFGIPSNVASSLNCNSLVAIVQFSTNIQKWYRWRWHMRNRMMERFIPPKWQRK